MRKEFKEFFHRNYGSHNSSAALKGETIPTYTDYNPVKISLVYRRDGVSLPETFDLMNAEERRFFSKHFKFDTGETVIVNASHPLVIESLSENVNAIINLKKINDLKSINHFIREANNKLPVYGLFGCCVEPKCVRKQKIFNKLPPLFSHVFYFFFFICNRMLPKLPFTSKFYLWMTGGCTRVMSKTEALGRMYAHGFKLVDEKRIGDKFHFIFHKIKKPLINHVPTYGIIFKMLRKGKNGKLIYVYKMRTMDAYSEYLQQYVYEQNNLDKGGKFKDDFRITTIGKFLRKYWIDELPMIINVLKGDMKIVGVRPISAHYLSFYSSALRAKRENQKPGLIPPFYADMPESISQIMASEMRYLHSYERSPFKTDVKYFFRAFYMIIIKKARSK